MQVQEWSPNAPKKRQQEGKLQMEQEHQGIKVDHVSTVSLNASISPLMNLISSNSLTNNKVKIAGMQVVICGKFINVFGAQLIHMEPFT